LDLMVRRRMATRRLLVGGLGREHGLAAVLTTRQAHPVGDARRAAAGASLDGRAVLTRLLRPGGALVTGAGWAAATLLQSHDTFLRSNALLEG
jgi:hypothetical protein